MFTNNRRRQATCTGDRDSQLSEKHIFCNDEKPRRFVALFLQTLVSKTENMHCKYNRNTMKTRFMVSKTL
jgi:hypothetical protein